MDVPVAGTGSYEEFVAARSASLFRTAYLLTGNRPDAVAHDPAPDDRLALWPLIAALPLRQRTEYRRIGAPKAQPGSGSRATGQLMQRGPPRPEPSSEPAIRTTSMPASSRRALVSSLRS